MNVFLIDLVDFFSDKHKIEGTKGIGATGIITINQMETRINQNSGNSSHEEERALIIRDIFDLPSWFCKYNWLDIKRLSKEKQQIITEPIFIRYTNSYAGNRIIIFIGKHNTITSNQLLALEYLNEEIKKVSQEIKIYLSINDKYYDEMDSLDNIILPILRENIDDSYKQILDDINIFGHIDLKESTSFPKTHILKLQ